MANKRFADGNFQHAGLSLVTGRWNITPSLAIGGCIVGKSISMNAYKSLSSRLAADKMAKFDFRDRN